MRRHLLSLVFLLSIPHLISAQPAIEVQKSGSGRSLVLLPGMGCPGEVWRDVVEPLAKEYSCHVVTLKCHGAPCTNDEYSVSRIIDQVAAIGRETGMKDPVLIGHSFGGYLALRLAIKYPDVFHKLIIVDTHPFPMGFVNPAATLDQASQQAATFKTVIEGQSDEQFTQQQTMMLKAAISDPVRLEQVVRWQVQSDRGVIAEAFYAMLSSDLREELSGIKAETLVIGTWKAAQAMGMTKDTARERFATQYANLPGCTIVMADEARHFIMFDDPDWLAAEISAFVEGSR
jgi:pimeloyl-ACP methyl ester carboxylesterase